MNYRHLLQYNKKLTWISDTKFHVHVDPHQKHYSKPILVYVSRLQKLQLVTQS